MLFGAAIIIIYTVMGGFMAVSTTDLIQSVVMSIALVIIVFFGISKAGGWDEMCIRDRVCTVRCTPGPEKLIRERF